MQANQSNSLRYFTAVAQHGSMRDAAEALHVAQSAISRQIMKAEERFGVALFERLPRGVRLTPAGEIFLRYARDNLSHLDRMRAELEGLKGLRRGTVRVHAVEALAHDLLPRAIGRFSERYPGLTFEVVIEGSDQIIEAVREMRTDIGLAYYVQAGHDIEVRFRVREPLVALMSPRHPLAAADRLALSDVAGYPVALPPGRSGSRVLIDAACKAAGIYLAPTLESNSMQLLARFVRDTRGITFQARLSAMEPLRNGELVAVKLRDRLMNSATIDALTLASRKLPIAAEEFQRFLYSELQSLRQETPTIGERGVTAEEVRPRVVSALKPGRGSRRRAAETA